MVLTASLPFGVWLLLALGLVRRGRAPLEALLLAAVLLGLVVAGLSEGLELTVGRWARPGLLHGVWALALAVSATFLLRAPAGAPPLAACLPSPSMPRSPGAVLLAMGLVLLALVLLLVAFGAPPNTFDALSYHLSRVRMWVQQAGIEPYASPDPRHVFMGSLPAWFQLHLRVLAGSDRWANIPQLWAWLLTAGGAALLARALGGDGRLQLAAAVCAASLPMAVLQAGTAMTDLFVTGWLAVAAALLFQRSFGGSRDLLTLACGGAALGLAVLTKGTGFIHGAAIGSGWVLAELWSGGWRPGRRGPLLGAVAVVLLCTALPSTPGWGRNLRLFGSALAPSDQQTALLNEVHSPRYVAFNLVRNGAMQLAAPHLELAWLGPMAPSERSLAALNRRLDGYNRGLVQRTVALGISWGIPDGEPRVSSTVECGLTTPTGCDGMGQLFTVHAMARDEDTGSNPFHFLLALGCLPVLLMVRRGRPRGELVVLGITVLLGVLLFHVQVKWQIWGSRLLLPMFVLAASWSMVVLGHLISTRLAMALAGLLLLLSAPFALDAELRPLWGQGGVLSQARASLRWSAVDYLEPVFSDLVPWVQQHEVRELGLVTRWSAPSYLVWTAFEDRGQEPPRVRYLDLPSVVAADFAIPASDQPRPDAILALFAHSFPAVVTHAGVRYPRVLDWPCGVALYAPE